MSDRKKKSFFFSLNASDIGKNKVSSGHRVREFDFNIFPFFAVIIAKDKEQII